MIRGGGVGVCTTSLIHFHHTVCKDTINELCVKILKIIGGREYVHLV